MRVAWLLSTVIIAITTVIARGLRDLLGLPDPEMLYLLAIMIAGLRFGRGPAILAAALSVGAYDFFFVHPVARFTVADWRYLLTFGMMLGVGFVVGSLVNQLAQEQRLAADRALKARTEEVRSALLATVSHDLRTPLASITGAATALRDQHGIPEHSRAELIAGICDEAERLERLVSNLLEMTRLQTGDVKVEREWVPVEELVGATLSRLETRLGDRPVRLDLAADLPLVPVDPVLLEQVLLNLLDNALKYTPAGSPLEIAAIRADGHVEVTVADHGPGFAEHERDLVFERFYRGGGHDAGGAGLGLAICHAIVVAHGGTITAGARAGGGARICIRLPLVGSPPAPPPQEPESEATNA